MRNKLMIALTAVGLVMASPAFAQGQGTPLQTPAQGTPSAAQGAPPANAQALQQQAQQQNQFVQCAEIVRNVRGECRRIAFSPMANGMQKSKEQRSADYQACIVSNERGQPLQLPSETGVAPATPLTGQEGLLQDNRGGQTGR
jgi:hypothetical protein